jgi:dTDP-4-dehydrorhamnose reductase
MALQRPRAVVACTTWWPAAKPPGTTTPAHVIDFARQAGVPESKWRQKQSCRANQRFPITGAAPAQLALDTRKLQNTFGVHLPLWQQGVNRMLTEILEKQS